MRIRNKFVLAVVATLGGVALVGVLPQPAGARTKPAAAPVFASKSTLRAKTLTPFSFTIKTKGNPVPAVTVVSGLPVGVTFTPDNANGTATLTGTVPGGPYPPIVLRASNGVGGPVTQNLTIAVKGLPGVRHIFVIMLENESYAKTFGTPANDPYLATTLPSMGAMLANYYGVGHFSNDNYVGFVSGQPPNSANQSDCAGGFVNFPPGATQGTNGIQSGVGCVYPAAVQTVADQLTARGDTWKAYEEDMGNDPARESPTCGHPAIGAADNTLVAEAGDGYATRHDPFVYFHSILDGSACNADVVPLGSTTGALPAGTPSGVTGLATDLQSAATTPNLSFITPNLCNDGHDYPCTNQTAPGTSALADVDAFLSTWVPKILNSPAFKQDGLLEVTFDEADVSPIDATSCCGETQGPNADSGGNGIAGPGGGRTGTVLISPFITPGTKVKTSLNHFSSLASIEDLFDLPRLGEARTVTSTFDKGVFIK